MAFNILQIKATPHFNTLNRLHRPLQHMVIGHGQFSEQTRRHLFLLSQWELIDQVGTGKSLYDQLTFYLKRNMQVIWSLGLSKQPAEYPNRPWTLLSPLGDYTLYYLVPAPRLCAYLVHDGDGNKTFDSRPLTVLDASQAFGTPGQLHLVDGSLTRDAYLKLKMDP
ncbi:hypothetical protein LY76DRAFT_610724 [Colletotrichum caudatum]|nr:hypothetical protein LY76DRAFT_610724 [Colletotrichum caudatum]